MRINNKFNLSLIYFYSTKGYEIQFSDDDDILFTDGIWSDKKIALIAFKKHITDMIAEGI